MRFGEEFVSATPLHWQVINGDLIELEGPRHGAPAHKDEVAHRVRSWLYEQNMRHVLGRSCFDLNVWLRRGRPMPMPLVRFFIGFYSAEEAFAFRIRWG